MINEPIPIRSIQHYMYCPHRWGLIEIDDAWTENFYVTKANLIHERVHDPDKNYYSRGRKVFTSLSVYNDLPEINIYGKTDCVELIPARDGLIIGKLDGRYRLCVIEYKPTKPKSADYNNDDLMQVFAQKICIDYIFGGCSDGYIYYADAKKRIKLPLIENYDKYFQYLKSILEEMRGYLVRGEVPQIRKGQKCSGCSMQEICMPFKKTKASVRSQIEDMERTSV